VKVTVEPSESEENLGQSASGRGELDLSATTGVEPLLSKLGRLEYERNAAFASLHQLQCHGQPEVMSASSVVNNDIK